MYFKSLLIFQRIIAFYKTILQLLLLARWCAAVGDDDAAVADSDDVKEVSGADDAAKNSKTKTANKIRLNDYYGNERIEGAIISEIKYNKSKTVRLRRQ